MIAAVGPPPLRSGDAMYRFPRPQSVVPSHRRCAADGEYRQQRRRDIMAAIESETFTKVRERAKQAEENIKSADAKRRADLKDRVVKAHERAAKLADEIDKKSDEIGADASALWQATKNSWNSHVQNLHDAVADKEAKLELHVAVRDAEHAENYAVSAVDFALAAIDQAEYAVLDAILARRDADELAVES